MLSLGLVLFELVSGVPNPRHGTRRWEALRDGALPSKLSGSAPCPYHHPGPGRASGARPFARAPGPLESTAHAVQVKGRAPGCRVRWMPTSLSTSLLGYQRKEVGYLGGWTPTRWAGCLGCAWCRAAISCRPNRTVEFLIFVSIHTAACCASHPGTEDFGFQLRQWEILMFTVCLLCFYCPFPYARRDALCLPR